MGYKEWKDVEPLRHSNLMWFSNNHAHVFFFADPHAFHQHFHLVNRVDLETVLQAAVFINDGDGQVRAAHKILGYTPLQKSFVDPRHVINASHPRLPKITVVESGFLISEGSSVPEGILLVDLSSSHQAAEDEGELDQSEEGFEVFDLPTNPRILLVI